MTIIARFLSKMILARFAAALLGISFFVFTLEMVGNLQSVLALAPNPLLAIGKYAAFRSPAIMSTFLPISLLLALLLSVTELSYRNEMPAIWSAGISPSRLIIMLLPMALVAGSLHFLIADQAVPAAAPTLRDWGIGDYAIKKNNYNPNDPIWLKAGDDLIRAKTVNDALTEMSDVIVFRREKDGLLSQQVFAKSAVKLGDLWFLKNANIFQRDGRPPTHTDALPYAGTMRLITGGETGDPEELTFVQLNDYIANDGYGLRPVYVYKTWWHKRLSPFLVSIIMLALCIPLSTRFRRGGGLGTLFVFGIGIGFVYFVADAMATSMGELGVVAPWLAAWTPIIVFGAIAMVLVARTEQA